MKKIIPTAADGTARARAGSARRATCCLWRRTEPGFPSTPAREARAVATDLDRRHARRRRRAGRIATERVDRLAQDRAPPSRSLAQRSRSPLTSARSRSPRTATCAVASSSARSNGSQSPGAMPRAKSLSSASRRVSNALRIPGCIHRLSFLRREERAHLARAQRTPVGRARLPAPPPCRPQLTPCLHVEPEARAKLDDVFLLGSQLSQERVSDVLLARSERRRRSTGCLPLRP